jgi:LuxR family maltose regulon positive regulatory protein
VLGHLDVAAGRVHPAVDRLGFGDVGRPGAADPWLSDWLRLQVAELWVAEGHPERALDELEAITHDDHLGGAVVAAAAYAEQGRRAAVEESLGRARTGLRPLPAEVTRLLVQGVHESRQRAPQRALTLVERALRLAEEEDLRRPFREAPPTVRRLLSGHPQLLRRHPWLAAPPGQPAPQPVQHAGHHLPQHPGQHAGQHPGQHPGQPAVQRVRAETDAELLVEPLTARETEVLVHLEELLTTEEIAGRMFVSVNTVRTHVRSILRKLGVNRRNSAVRRARELGLLDRGERPAG